MIISHIDEVAEEDREAILDDACHALAIDSNSILTIAYFIFFDRCTDVFFLENYTDTKVKQFHLDKMILRILLALLSRADDFISYDAMNPSM